MKERIVRPMSAQRSMRNGTFLEGNQDQVRTTKIAIKSPSMTPRKEPISRVSMLAEYVALSGSICAHPVVVG